MTDILSIVIEESPIDWRASASLSHRHRESVMDQASDTSLLMMARRTFLSLCLCPGNMRRLLLIWLFNYEALILVKIVEIAVLYIA